MNRATYKCDRCGEVMEIVFLVAGMIHRGCGGTMQFIPTIREIVGPPPNTSMRCSEDETDWRNSALEKAAKLLRDAIPIGSDEWDNAASDWLSKYTILARRKTKEGAGK